MFTGIIENTGMVSSVISAGGGIKISLKPKSDMDLRIGDSLAVNGVCLTVVKSGEDIVFEVSPETIRSTNFGELRVSSKVNLERPLRFSDRLGGHIVTGHVDGVGVIKDKKQEGDYTIYNFEAPPEILKYTVKKGSVAIDGISLTVNGIESNSFSVAIIPHTLTATNIGDKAPGDKVNIEIDIIGKYVEKFMGEKGFTE